MVSGAEVPKEYITEYVQNIKLKEKEGYGWIWLDEIKRSDWIPSPLYSTNFWVVNAGKSTFESWQLCASTLACRWACCKGSTTGTGGAPLHHVEGLQRQCQGIPGVDLTQDGEIPCQGCFADFTVAAVASVLSRKQCEASKDWFSDCPAANHASPEQEKSIRDVSSRWGRTLCWILQHSPGLVVETSQRCNPRPACALMVIASKKQLKHSMHGYAE